VNDRRSAVRAGVTVLSGVGEPERLLDGLAAGARVVHVAGGRGSGRTHVLEAIGGHAADRGAVVVRCTGHPADRSAALVGLASLLRPLASTMTPEHQAQLAPIVALDAVAFDAGALRRSVFRALTDHAARRPLVVLVDDVDDVDPDTIDVLSFFVRRIDADPVLVVSAGAGAAPWPGVGEERRIEPLPDEAVTAMLVDRGVALLAAESVATVARGNPGLAVAVAASLSNEQRTGRAPVALLPMPAGAAADDLLVQMRVLGDRIGRALAVAASEPDGDVERVRSALSMLGEPVEVLDAAEASGLVRIDGPVIRFRDPWSALVATQLVAPASRRAVHRALATLAAGPHEGAVRAWHLAAAADGSDDAAADAVGAVGAHAAARGAARTAIVCAQRAALLAADPDRRVDHLLDGLSWALDAADVAAVRGLRESLAVPSTAPSTASILAVAEASAFLDGPGSGALPGDLAVVSDRDRRWADRRYRRLAFVAAVAGGDHRTARTVLAEAPGDPLGDGLGAAWAARHAGELRGCRARLSSSSLSADVPGERSWSAMFAAVLAADLDVLTGRGLDAIDRVSGVTWPADLEPHVRRIVGRATLQCDPAVRPADRPDAFDHDDVGTLGEVRSAIARGVLGGTLDDLRSALDLAASLPVEAAEARLWLVVLGEPNPQELRAAAGALERCGARGWMRRLERPPTPPTATHHDDPALDALTKAERRVAHAVADGMTNREAAAHLFVSVKTVDFHLQQIYRKLAVRSRTELAVRMINASPMSDPGGVAARRGAP
jgi:DNA-binding CsgD family transcriptional regulator